MIVMSGCGASEDLQTFETTDGNYELTVGSQWKNVTDPEEESVLLDMEKNDATYMTLTAEDRIDVKLSLPDYVKKCDRDMRDTMEGEFGGNEEIHLKKAVPVEGSEYKMMKAVLTEKDGEVTIFTDMYYIETKKHLITAVCIYTDETENQMDKEYEEIMVNGFREK